MSRFFGNPTQAGIVVEDLNAAIRYWTETVGAGPFFVIDPVPHLEFTIGRTPAATPDMRIALGNWGDMQVELIEPRGNHDATWHRFLRDGRRGLHHFSVWTWDYDAMIAAAFARGETLEVSGKLTAGVRYSYFETRLAGAPLVEVSELTPETKAAYDFVRECARDWDGRDPVRSFG